MILKERNDAEHPDTDKWSQAGAEAEKKMAFYLRRMFLDDQNIFIFNDLRYKDDTGDAAQIDHLVLHRHGFIIIESKSVCSGVAVNKHGEWVRFWDGKPKGMESPVQQAKFQAEFLRRALNAYAESLVGKTLGFIQTLFYKCPLEVVVAISDQGSIKREIDLPEVVKADQVPDRIRETYARHKKESSLLTASVQALKWSNTAGLYTFTDEEMKKISGFLLEHHYPLPTAKAGAGKGKTTKRNEYPEPRAQPAKVAEPPPPPPSGSLGLCTKCGGQCVINWGKYGYYWKCIKCGNNMAIKEYCPVCRKKLLLRKAKNDYFIHCEICGNERPYCKFVTD